MTYRALAHMAGQFSALLQRPVTRCLLLAMTLVVPCAVLAAGGQEIFERRCHKCHVRPDPRNYTPEQWVIRLTRMIPIAPLTRDEYEAVLAYVLEHAGTEETALNEERLAFDRVCRICHASLGPTAPPAWLGTRLDERLVEHYEALEDAGEVDDELDEDLAHEAAEYLLFSNEFNWEPTSSQGGG